MIDKPEDIEATVLALEAQVPAGCETFAPPRPPTSAVVTRYFGNVRVVEAFDPVASALAKTDPPVLSKSDPGILRRRNFPLTLFL
jgi:hypothetical protein